MYVIYCAKTIWKFSIFFIDVFNIITIILFKKAVMNW